MVNATLEALPTVVAVSGERSLSRFRICEFGSEECDVLVDLAPYRRVEAILRAAERHATVQAPRTSDRGDTLGLTSGASLRMAEP
jgi:hypothetical protein